MYFVNIIHIVPSYRFSKYIYEMIIQGRDLFSSHVHSEHGLLNLEPISTSHILKDTSIISYPLLSNQLPPILHSNKLIISNIGPERFNFNDNNNSLSFLGLSKKVTKT